MIVLIVLGAVLVLGGGACVVVGGLVFLGARAEPAPPTPPEATGAPLAPAPPTATGAPAATSLSPMGEDDPPSDPTDPSDDPASASAQGSTPAAPTATTTSGGPNWWCTASGSVRVCGFAGACTHQTVFGNAGGKDRFLAQMQAKNACESMARAKGGSTVCIVQCTMR